MPMKHLMTFAALTLLAGCAEGQAAPAQSAAPPPPRAVEVLTLAPTELRETTEYLGTLTSRASIEVRPQAGGYVQAIHVQPGQRVEAGAPLVDIDAREERAAVDSAKARVASARAQLNQARRTLARVQKLHDEGLATAEELERTRSDVEVARAAQLAAAAQVSQQEVQLGHHVVRAPGAGVVGDLLVRVGDAVNAGQTLTTLAESSELELSVLVPAERARAIRVPESTIEVLGARGEVVYESHVFFVAPQADPRTQLVEVKAKVDNRAGLRERELVRARVLYARREALQVPALALVRQSGQAFVYVLADKDGGLVAEKRPIRLGALRERGFEVTGGLAAGDRLAVSSIQLLKDGSPVTVEVAGASAAEGAPETPAP